jgi:hypothetical protein
MGQTKNACKILMDNPLRNSEGSVKTGIGLVLGREGFKIGGK